MKKPVRKYRLVHIVWHDAALHGTRQVSLDELKDYGIMRGHSTGWLIKETKVDVTLSMDFFPAQEQNEQDTFRCLSSYPKSGIDKMTTLKTLEVHYDDERTMKNATKIPPQRALWPQDLGLEHPLRTGQRKRLLREKI